MECIDPYLMNIDGPTCNSNWNHHSTPNSNQPVVSSLLIISIRSLTVPSWSKLRMYNIRLRKDFPRANCRMRRLASVDMKNQHYPKSINKKRHAMNRRSQWRLAPSCKALLPSLRMFPDSPEKFLHQNPLPRNPGQSLKSIPPRKLPKVPGESQTWVLWCHFLPPNSIWISSVRSGLPHDVRECDDHQTTPQVGYILTSSGYTTCCCGL
jgi:hypothetical protein